MFNPFGIMVPLRHISPELHKWIVEVQVMRKWVVPRGTVLNGSSSFEMVLIDSERTKIQASLTREVNDILEADIHEGLTYLLSGLEVVSNDEELKTTRHAYKLLFKKTTSVTYCQIPLIRDFGLSPLGATEILKCRNDNEDSFLVDMVGILTSISSVRQHRIEGKLRKFILLELTDFNGKVECALWDENVETIRGLLRCHGKCTPIIGVQFAQVMLFDCVLYGDVVIQDVTNITRVIINPHVPESYQLMNCLSILGLDFYGRSCGPTLGNQFSLEEEFLILNDRERIGVLHSKKKALLSVVSGKIVGFAHGRPWWYMSCTCRTAVVADVFMYYCPNCKLHTLHVTPRYKLIAKVDDGENSEWFAFTDIHAEQLLGKSCKDMILSVQDPFKIDYHSMFYRAFEKELLLLVDQRVIGEGSIDHYYQVKGFCADVGIVKRFLVGDYQLIDDKDKFLKFLASYNREFKSDVETGSTFAEFSGSQTTDFLDFLGERRNSANSLSKSLDEEMCFVSSGSSLDDGLGD